MTDPLTEITVGAASCRIYRDAPQWQGQRTAAIGQFHCANVDDGASVLIRSRELLRAEGFSTVIGPMDGDTWHRYRVVVESDGTPPFVMEPVSGPHDLAAFQSAGFQPISSYLSARASLDDAIGSGPPVEIDGMRLQAWDGSDAKALIGKLFEFSSRGFSRNAFFKPIDLPEFLKIYEPVIPAIDPRFVLFAFSGSEPVGFLFGFPNGTAPQQPASVVLKTYASARHGVGRLLADAFHRTARQLGFSEVIHALMHVDNVSRKNSELHGATIFRRYALMGCQLVP
jgi:hypothetical protein